MRGRTAAMLLGTMLALGLGGCSDQEQERATVHGQVQYRGRVVPGGSIVFAPDTDRGTPNELAIGQIKPDGTYQLESDKGGAIAPGWYRVSIGPSPAAAGLRLPDKFRDPLRSGLECQVQPGRENVLNFNLQ
jgi:hypothetical protein